MSASAVEFNLADDCKLLRFAYDPQSFFCDSRTKKDSLVGVPSCLRQGKGESLVVSRWLPRSADPIDTLMRGAAWPVRRKRSATAASWRYVRTSELMIAGNHTSSANAPIIRCLHVCIGRSDQCHRLSPEWVSIRTVPLRVRIVPTRRSAVVRVHR